MAIELDPNEIARRLAANNGVVGPKFTVSIDPPEFENNPQYVQWLMMHMKLITQMLEFFFASQGFKGVVLKWENLDKMRKPQQ